MATLPKSIIDAHVHFWHPDKVHVPWVKDSAFDRRKDALDYSEQVEEINARCAIYVETDVDPCHGLVEADWITHYAEQWQPTKEFGGIEGIVAFAPIYQGRHVEGYLRTLKRLTNKRLKGVRYLIQDPSRDPLDVLKPDFIQGVQMLAEFDLSFDLNINCNECPEQFPPLQELVAQCSRVQFILDHMGKPPCDSVSGEERFEFWKEQMMQLSRYPNVACKVSGLMTEMKDIHKKNLDEIVSRLKPFVQVAKESFGSDRLMFGGDWPVCELSSLKWQDWYKILCEITKEWSEDDRQKLFVTNAIRIYNIN